MMKKFLMGALALFCAACVATAEEPAGEHHSTGEKIARWMRGTGLPDELTIVAISTLPIVELRGAIPVGHMMFPDTDRSTRAGRDDWGRALRIFVLAVIGNMIPIPFILLLLGPVSRWMMKARIGKKFFDWLFARTRRKAANIEKYETLGLTIFVAIPLPVTGGWTGAAAAFLMGMKFHHAMLSILMGVMIAGVIMTVLSLMGWLGALVAAAVLLSMAAGAVVGLFRKEERH